MPQRRTSIKELRKTHKKHMHNLDIRTDLRKTIKSFLSSVKTKDTADAQAKLKTLFKKIDKAAKRKIIHKNTASRRKSTFAKLIANKA